ncbi:MAG: hypothetical protein JW966_00495, partial [Anaerolineae bacterium]|nr:hypothetical protein [Anaerolineae bacterium]
MYKRYPDNQGLYNSANEHDSCGIGFVANIKGRKSYDIIRRGLEVLERMTHRGAESADNRTGDGAGVMIQIPDAFYRAQNPGLPPVGQYAPALVFLPRDPDQATACIHTLEDIVRTEGLDVIGWRDIPVNSDV